MGNVLKRVYASRKISSTLKIVSHLCVLISVAVYAILVASSFVDSVRIGITMLMLGGAPFVIVTLVRRWINAPRPYELYDFYEKRPKEKSGQSFPSRHTFSAFTVAALSYILSPWLAVALGVFGVALAVSRVLLGMHFIRDVVAGALIGIISGIIGLIILL